MITRHKILIFFIIFFSCFCIFSWGKLQENFEIIFAIGDGKDIQKYNSSLEMAKKGDFQNALKNLPENIKNFEERLSELRGDIFFKEKYATGEILKEYEKSFEIEKNERISYKISLLKNENENSKKSEENSSSETPKEIQEKQEEIAQDQQNRKEFLNPNRSSLGNFERDLKNLKELLKEENISEVKDW